jgi:DNA repair and recombination RAD54-like protein
VGDVYVSTNQVTECVVDSAEDVERHLTLDSLRELFQYHAETTSDTHDTFKRKRCKPDGKQHIKAPAMMYGDTSTWNHFVNDGLQPIQDLWLRQGCGEQEVSAVFKYM